MPTPFRHGISNPPDNRSEFLWWMQLYRSTGLLINDELPLEATPITEVGAWSVAQSSDCKRDVLYQGAVSMFRYLMVARAEREPSWMAIYEGIARVKERFCTTPYVLPGQPPTWIPITELGAWMRACTDEQRELVERRAQIIKEAYERILEGV